jgi:hypothetical protein
MGGLLLELKRITSMTRSTEAPGTAWDTHVQWTMQARNLSISEAMDAVAIAWLKRGDERACAEFLLRGHLPGPNLARFLAWMLVNEDNARHLPTSLEKEVPYRFELRPRSGQRGRRQSVENAIRDIVIASNVYNLMREMSYEAAIARVQQAGQDLGVEVGVQTIRDAYDRHFGKK